MAHEFPSGYFAKNIDPIGYHDLNGKPAFKLAIQEVKNRWYLYVAHLWHRGWSVRSMSRTRPRRSYAPIFPGRKTPGRLRFRSPMAR